MQSKHGIEANFLPVWIVSFIHIYNIVPTNTLQLGSSVIDIWLEFLARALFCNYGCKLCVTFVMNLYVWVCVCVCVWRVCIYERVCEYVCVSELTCSYRLGICWVGQSRCLLLFPDLRARPLLFLRELRGFNITRICASLGLRMKCETLSWAMKKNMTRPWFWFATLL